MPLPSVGVSQFDTGRCASEEGSNKHNCGLRHASTHSLHTAGKKVFRKPHTSRLILRCLCPLWLPRKAGQELRWLTHCGRRWVPYGFEGRTPVATAAAPPTKAIRRVDTATDGGDTCRRAQAAAHFHEPRIPDRSGIWQDPDSESPNEFPRQSDFTFNKVTTVLVGADRARLPSSMQRGLNHPVTPPRVEYLSSGPPRGGWLSSGARPWMESGWNGQ